MNIEIATAFKMIKELGDCYIVGGSLLPHPIRDYDILIFNHKLPDFCCIKRYWERHYKEYGASEVKCYAVYDEDDEGKSAIVKIKVQGIWIDLLYVSKNFHMPVENYMDLTFPISVQRVAISLSTGLLYGAVDVENITFFCEWDSKYLIKYQKYYPNAWFKKVKQRSLSCETKETE